MRANQEWEAEDAENQQRSPGAEPVVPREERLPDPDVLEGTPTVERVLRVAGQDIKKGQWIAVEGDAHDDLRQRAGHESANDRQPSSHRRRPGDHEWNDD